MALWLIPVDFILIATRRLGESRNPSARATEIKQNIEKRGRGRGDVGDECVCCVLGTLARKNIMVYYSDNLTIQGRGK